MLRLAVPLLPVALTLVSLLPPRFHVGLTLGAAEAVTLALSPSSFAAISPSPAPANLSPLLLYNVVSSITMQDQLGAAGGPATTSLTTVTATIQFNTAVTGFGLASLVIAGATPVDGSFAEVTAGTR